MSPMGPLKGVRVVELASGAPCAFAATLLADLGADVVRVDRPGAGTFGPADPLGRSRRSVTADLKDPDGVRRVRALVERADVLLEGLRPGACERLGLGPEAFAEANPGLVYARVSGWGQTGPWARRPGHDISFLALAGLLDADADAAGSAAPPSTYLSTFAGGGLLQVLGVLAALHERSRSGRGQVVDAAMVDGAALLEVMVRQWRENPGNVTVTDAPFYTTYPCQDGRYVAVGAIEGRFYDVLLAQLGLDGDAGLPDRDDRAAWPLLRDRIGQAFAARPRDYWAKVFAEHEACVVPVLGPEEAAEHPALRDRATFTEVAGRPQPSPAPRFSRTPSPAPRPAPRPGDDTALVPDDWGVPA
ncbi:CaiB/BaiF CoA-transferase family protein [Streptomyces sp. NPDC004542]|uniref:CaiB/BaiF CoA transferase family protein n=1 Tax=Streptomyces sp. NPDC004542 TaxID=3154281 RepID=UPI00339DFA04